MLSFIQIVFRSDPGKFKNLKYDCDDFLTVVQNFVSLITAAKDMHTEEISGQLRNWQVTFVDQDNCMPNCFYSPLVC